MSPMQRFFLCDLPEAVSSLPMKSAPRGALRTPVLCPDHRPFQGWTTRRKRCSPKSRGLGRPAEEQTMNPLLPRRGRCLPGPQGSTWAHRGPRNGPSAGVRHALRFRYHSLQVSLPEGQGCDWILQGLLNLSNRFCWKNYRELFLPNFDKMTYYQPHTSCLYHYIPYIYRKPMSSKRADLSGILTFTVVLS